MPERRTQTHVTVDHDEIRRWAEERESVNLETGETKAAMPRRRKQIERFGRPLKGERRSKAAAARTGLAEKPARKAGPSKRRARPTGKKRR